MLASGNDEVCGGIVDEVRGGVVDETWADQAGDAREPQVVNGREAQVDGREVEAPDWRQVHAKLATLRQRRAQLDHEEMLALRDAMRVQVWREVGAASMREYLERVLGYGPRAANERLRVAGVLDAMPVLGQALASGDLPYSAVREISRVATSTTQEDWGDACRGKNLRQIEALVSQRAEGDLPDSPPRPELQKFVVRLELSAAEYALWRQARQQVQEEQGASLEEHQVFAAMCARTIEGPTAAGDSKETERRRGPVPGCRASRFIEVHHIEHREDGGDHRPENLTSLCGGHHDAHHRGALRITGCAPDLTFDMFVRLARGRASRIRSMT